MSRTESGKPVHNQTLRHDIAKAAEILENTLRQMAPNLAPSLCRWMRKLAGTPYPSDYFLHPEAFPMFLLPYWVEKATGAKAARPFRRDVIYSTLSGYYSIRLMDNIMDRDGDGEVQILPAVQIFLLECFRPYALHFPSEHPFWKTMRATWFRSADASAHDALLETLDATAFANVAAQKVCAVKIPVEAVCHYYARPDLIPLWNALADALGWWHQMLNDVFDWRKDLEHGNNSYFLSEARHRAQPGEGTAEWVIREGFRWGIESLEDRMEGLQATAVELHSPGLRVYLRQRKARLNERLGEMAQPVHAMQQLVAAIQANR